MRKPSPIVRHHLLEVILWPCEDGTLREILNTASKLNELGIYNDRLTITCSRADHARLHASGKIGIKRSDESRKKMSVSAKKSYEMGGHQGGRKFRGRTWRLVNGRRVWDAT